MDDKAGCVRIKIKQTVLTIYIQKIVIIITDIVFFNFTFQEKIHYLV